MKTTTKVLMSVAAVYALITVKRMFGKGAAEKVGKKADKFADKVGDKVHDVASKVQDVADRVSYKANNAADELAR